MPTNAWLAEANLGIHRDSAEELLSRHDPSVNPIARTPLQAWWSLRADLCGEASTAEEEAPGEEVGAQSAFAKASAHGFIAPAAECRADRGSGRASLRVRKDMVEAAGVEPASGNSGGNATPCSVPL